MKKKMIRVFLFVMMFAVPFSVMAEETDGFSDGDSVTVYDEGSKEGWMDGLTDEEISEKIEEDIKNNPDLVEDAIPYEIYLQDNPYELFSLNHVFDYYFNDFHTTPVFHNGPLVNMRSQVDNYGPAITISMYTESGTFVGSTNHAAGAVTVGTFSAGIGRHQAVVTLTNDNHSIAQGLAYIFNSR